MRFGLGGYALEQVQTHGGAVVGRDPAGRCRASRRS